MQQKLTGGGIIDWGRGGAGGGVAGGGVEQLFTFVNIKKVKYS